MAGRSRFPQNKYGNTKVEVDGIQFDSKREAKRYTELKLLERAGVIRNLELQPKFDIVIDGRPVRYGPGKSGRKGKVIQYISDFSYFENNERVIEDSKGFKTPDYKIKKALVEHIYHVVIKEV